jgi:small-conductance mechanosensitive channel
MTPLVKKILGIFLILVGIFALLTPFTPGSWLAFVGLELLGVRVAFWDKIKEKIFPAKK